MHRIIIVLICLSFLHSCKNEKMEGDLYFKTNYDDLRVFHESGQFVRTEGHSGMYCGKVDSTNVYGIGFNSRLGDVLYRRVNKVKASVWCKYLAPNTTGKLVISFLNGSESAEWVGVDISNKMGRMNTWEKIEAEVIFANNVKITPDTKLYVYVWNTSKQEIYYDDLEISFED